MRINKYISETGICSRREADQWIEQGRVTINQQPATLGSKVEAGDEVHIDGKLLDAKPAPVYIALNKPVGITCTTEAHVKDNIVDFVGHKERIFPIGRLDKDSEGLILLTNDGDIVNEILRVENAHEKEYVVVVDRPITAAFLGAMRKGVRILDTVTKPCKVTQIDNTTFNIVLTQGLNRQIRRMCAAFDYRVLRLKRIRIMHIEIGNLKKGRWRNLTEKEVAALMK
ncbi:MAG TPA: 23S rRNA pseudouridine(2604) synthase RluF [Steroidobacteraceae bacterium]|nr:23S rRNA pseudouridine(2604) synthase RluF [Steroidobacteraceae bacterium]